MKFKIIFSWILRLVVAYVLLQTLFYKFTAHPDSVYIFTKLGVEPWGRIGLGVVELIVAFLVLIPRTKFIGMGLSFLIIVGALFSHILVIGLDIHGDGGGLFTLALIVLVSTILFFILNKEEFKTQLNTLKNFA